MLNFQKRQMTALVWLCALANANPSSVRACVPFPCSVGMVSLALCVVVVFDEERIAILDNRTKSYIACECVYAHIVCDLRPASCGERWKRDGERTDACNIYMNWHCEYWHWNWTRNTHKHTGNTRQSDTNERKLERRRILFIEYFGLRYS